MVPAFSSEDALVRKLRKLASSWREKSPARRRLALPMGDDAALWRPRPGQQTILSCDWFLEGTHFLRERHPPESVGWKCLARALSDIAAMGGVPRCFLLGLALPRALTSRWLDNFLDGLGRASRKFHCVLAGGDTTRRDQVLIHITVVGEIRSGHAILRVGAREGDRIYVSGRLGEAALGLEMLTSRRVLASKPHRALWKHLYPEPRLALGQWLAAKRRATAMMDISDGLSSDLRRLLPAPHLGALLEAQQLPAVQTPPGRPRKGPAALELALDGGDDYELLFTARPGTLPSRPWKFRGLAVSPVGYVTAGPALVCRDAPSGAERTFGPGGWDPFRSRR